jgi:predicted enzyme related to lactoylglutathione lyase
MIENRSVPPGPIVPVLSYEDVAQAIDWLSRAFGFTERLRTPPEADGRIHHAQLAVGAGTVMLNGRAGSQGSVTSQHIQAMFVPVEDVDAHFERAKLFGARILRPPKSCEFGESQYTAEDPAGYQWTFSQSLADVVPEDWGARVPKIESRLALLPRPRLCYLEIPAVDLSESVAFYARVFGWNIRHRESSHPSFDDATGNVSGAWVTGRVISRDPGLLPYVWVDSIDATLARVVACGGVIVEAQQLDSPGGEWIARFRDPAGNVIGLYQEGPR